MLLKRYTEQRQRCVVQGARGFGDAGWAAAAACEGWVMLTRENTRHDAVAKIISYRNPAPVEYEELANELIAREQV